MLKELLLVIAITDGDTIKVQNAERETLKVRLANIDAPELGQDYGQESKQLLKRMIAGKKVSLNCPTKDRYRRLICTIRHRGKDINKEMIEKGGAWVYRRYYKGQDYIDAEARAKRNKRGLWSKKAIPPWEYRRKR